MKIQTIVSCVNLWVKYTKPCLDSIKTKHENRIYLADNGSIDETKVEASKLVSDRFVYKRNESNRGLSSVWNAGMIDGFKNGADYILFLNNDILIHPDSIDNMVERLQKGPDDIVLISMHDVRGECKNPEDIFTFDIKSKETVEESEHPNFSGCMINRRCWEEVGNFDEMFSPAYFEDNDYHYRIKLLGLKAICLPTAPFYHYGSRSQNESTTVPLVSSYRFEINGRYYIEKWGGQPGSERYRKPFNKDG